MKIILYLFIQIININTLIFIINKIFFLKLKFQINKTI